MGRLTLNVLLSFAQFEREVIGERMRDKIAASKKKGMWMGGMPPLGYDVKDRKLIVNEDEAKIVVHILSAISRSNRFTRCATSWLRPGSAASPASDPTAAAYGGQKLCSRRSLRAAAKPPLPRRDRLQRRRLSRRTSGDHRFVLWDAAQATLAANRVERATGVRANRRACWPAWSSMIKVNG